MRGAADWIVAYSHRKSAGLADMASTDAGGKSRARAQQEGVESRLETPTGPSAGGVNGDTGK